MGGLQEQQKQIDKICSVSTQPEQLEARVQALANEVATELKAVSESQSELRRTRATLTDMREQIGVCEKANADLRAHIDGLAIGGKKTHSADSKLAGVGARAAAPAEEVSDASVSYGNDGFDDPDD